MRTCSALQPPPCLGKGATPSDSASCTCSGWVKAGTPAENEKTNMGTAPETRAASRAASTLEMATRNYGGINQETMARDSIPRLRTNWVEKK